MKLRSVEGAPRLPLRNQAMKAVALKEILPFEQYEILRPRLHALFIAEKERRRLAAGEHLTLSVISKMAARSGTRSRRGCAPSGLTPSTRFAIRSTPIPSCCTPPRT